MQQQQQGSGSNCGSTDHAAPTIILERASIDEFFLDVTAAVTNDNDDFWLENAFQNVNSDDDINNNAAPKPFSQRLKDVQQSTVNIGKTSNNDSATRNEDAFGLHDGEYKNNDEEEDDEEALLYWKGAMIAQGIRNYVYRKLGFTLSAGIGINKTLAKLAASYGKPNGQAVALPSCTHALLDQTPIRKCRHLGGKLGKAVTELLQPHQVEPTVGNIRRYLSLTELQHGLQRSKCKEESAVWVHQLAQGIDNEAVTSTADATGKGGDGLTKSITAFKSFPTGRTKGLTVTEASDWIRLLAQEVVGRIERDSHRNHRYPKTCAIHYALPGWRSHQSRSVRIPFPPEELATDKVAELVRQVPVALSQKEGPTQRYSRVGLCATDFILRQTGQQGVDAFFKKAAAAAASPTSPDSGLQSKSIETIKDKTIHGTPLSSAQPPPKLVCRNSTTSFDDDLSQKRHDGGQSQPLAVNATTTNDTDRNSDLALARKLQASYDRENQVWQRLENRHQKRKHSRSSSSSKKISAFFTTKKR